MAKAVWKGKTIAESEEFEFVEGNIYFPPDKVNREFLKETDYHTICPWKGDASYYNVVVDGKVNENAAWYYPQPSEKAQNIKNYVAFWQGVEVSRD